MGAHEVGDSRFDECGFARFRGLKFNLITYLGLAPQALYLRPLRGL